MKYDFIGIEEKWQKIWEEKKLSSADFDKKLALLIFQKDWILMVVAPK